MVAYRSTVSKHMPGQRAARPTMNWSRCPFGKIRSERRKGGGKE